ncbi:MAG: ABC transporter permease [Steroidobacteraceae bacterium]|nr:ABC transporter permease [Steroidobacteraceae bacterium]
MLLHDTRLALRSLKRNPILSLLMIVTIAVGIAASMIAMTVYSARAGHPIPWKEDKLFAVTMDTRDEGPPPPGLPLRNYEYPPFTLGYQDAMAVYRSDIPRRSVVMYRTGQLVMPERANIKPFYVPVRVTTADFFAMFDVPFRYGGGWPRAADTTAEPVVVISKYLNDKLFGGVNSLGREITLGGRQFKIIGVLDAWMPHPRFYDLSGGGFDLPEDAFVPFEWVRAGKMFPQSISCVRRTSRVVNFESLFTEECLWLQSWVELADSAAHARFQDYVDNYVRDQKQRGRMPRPLNNRIVNVSTWLDMNNVVGDDTRMQVIVAVAFLVVCVLNTVGLILAKFLSAAPIAGLRRALGATRLDIVRQHLTEVVIMGLIGGALGLILSFGGLRLLHALIFSRGLETSDNPARLTLAQSFTHMDFSMLLLAVVLSVLTGILAGIYPAWRIGRLAPATFLKTQ